MRHLRWLPLAFLAGQHGFVIFAPYAAVLLALSPLFRRGSAHRVATAS